MVRSTSPPNLSLPRASPEPHPEPQPKLFAFAVAPPSTSAHSSAYPWPEPHAGTQHIFDAEPRVLFTSLHRFGSRFFPGSGALREVGEGALTLTLTLTR